MKISFTSLGCPKNAVDLEMILGSLGDQIEIINTPEKADAIIINTCAFITSAKQEAIDTIFAALQIKKKNPHFKVLVTGCLPQRYHQVLADELYEVDAFFDSRDPLVTANQIKKFFGEKVDTTQTRKLLTPSHYAYLQISSGCNNRCSYCAIPLIKGPYSSRNFNDILSEAKMLAQNGVQELILIAQDTTFYGRDLAKGHTLSELLTACNDIPQLNWIRLLYTHPAHWSNELIESIVNLDKVVKYIDLPIQHISNRILQKMGRHISEKELRSLVDKLRIRIPDLKLRTSIIVGFPGETKAEFQELVSFVEKTQFERLGVFTYSSEEGTSAYDLIDDVPEETKEARQEEIMEIQTDISEKLNKNLIGQDLDVVIDELDHDTNQAIARTKWDAPEIDNSVILTLPQKIGDFKKVKITAADVYDLYAKDIS